MLRLGKIKSAADSFLNKYKTENPASYAAAQQAVGGLLVIDGFIGIDNPFGKNKRSGIFGSVMGVIVGLLLLFGTSFMGNIFGINNLTATTTATVVEVTQPTRTSSKSGSSCTPQATYTVNGKDYTQTSTSGSSSACALTAGQTIAINYDPNNPGAWAYDLQTAKTVLKIFPIAGAIVAMSSVWTFIVRLLSILFGWKLLKNGRALAKTLPAGTDLSTIKQEIKKNFAKYLFGLDPETVTP